MKTNPSIAGGATGRRMSTVEVCAGGGGMAVGLEQAGFDPILLLDNRPVACETLRLNRPAWDVREVDLLDFDPNDHQQTYDVDLLSAGPPRVKASATVSRTRGSEPEEELLRAIALLAPAMHPRAIVIENVSEMVTHDAYAPLRGFIGDELKHLGYRIKWLVLDAADFGVPQHRKQGVLVALKGDAMDAFEMPAPMVNATSVGVALGPSMRAQGWADAAKWAAQACELAPTLVGGSWERGGADLGPTGTKRAWARMGVNGGALADQVPDTDFVWAPEIGTAGMVKLTVPQTACLQGFSDEWKFAGRKTAQYRQIGNATPPPVARALGSALRMALLAC